MTGREQGRRRMPRGWRAVAIAAVATAAVIGTVSGVLASAQGTPAAAAVVAKSSHAGTAAVPLTDVSVTPKGWSPVPWERAQLSVPGAWLVETPQQLSCGFPQVTGMIFAGTKPAIPKNYGCGVTASVAWMLPAGKLPKGISHRKPTAVIHGIPVYRLASGKGTTVYLVPELGVRIGARGASAARVLATLTRSPLAVVVGHGRDAAVPAGWAEREFGGLWFAAPGAWTVQREDQWGTCGTGLNSGSLLLMDATKPPFYLPCPYQIPTALAYQAQPGLTVVTGKYAAKSVGQTYASCQSRRGLRICLSSVTGQGGFLSGVLIFSVSRPKHPTAYFLLGLSGSGASARAVFDSVSATRP
jgi:hypothetical protein